jgi:hypothetical protein
MFNWYELEMQVRTQERSRDMARHQQLGEAMAARRQSAFSSRAALWWGRRLVAAGNRLQDRHASGSHAAAQPTNWAASRFPAPRPAGTARFSTGRPATRS